MARFELYGTSSCPYTSELREWLEWKNYDFVEFDVERDREARDRMRELSGGSRTVPILVEGGRVVQTGWQGQGCLMNE